MSPTKRAPLAAVPIFLLSAGLSAVTITVNDAGDAVHSPGCATTGTGTCTLRDAITFANSTDAADEIHFAIAGAGVHTIHPTSALPIIRKPVTIDGYTQPGSSPNTLAAGDDAVLSIELSGDLIAGSAHGLTFDTDSSTIRGLAINRFSNTAIWIDGTGNDAGGHAIEGNFIGTDPTGTIAQPNGTWGIFVRSPDNRIGGTTPAARNVISGNGPPPGAFTAGIRFEGDFGATVDGCVVQGNYIGTDKSGTAALPNGDGIATFGGVGVTIGGTAVGAGNLISGNAFYGINLGTAFCSDTTTHTIQGNRIGTDVAGSGALGNALGGIHAFCATHDNTIGGTVAGAGNVIAFNGAGGSSAGGVVLASNTAGNAVLGNSIFSNTSTVADRGLGIDLNIDGPTADDACDADTGANGKQNYPILVSVVQGAGSVDIHGTLDAAASASYRIEFFSNPTPDPSGFDEGQIYLGFKDVGTDASCHATFTATFSGTAVNVTATATDPSNNTSEFSHAQVIPAALEADGTNLTTSDGNGVFEPNETVRIRPSWKNVSGGTLTLAGAASGLAGPPGGAYATVDGAADYGSMSAGSTKPCLITDCFAMSAAPTAGRPVTHWDTTFAESPSTSEPGKTWTLHLGDSFTDVPRTQLFYKKIETIFHNGITVGCTATAYCPADKVPRSQMAIFIARGIAKGAPLPTSGTALGKPYNCVGGGTSAFADVSPTDIFCKGVHHIAAQNVTAGCDATHYCPSPSVTRSEMAIFMAKGIVAPGGGAAVPLTYGPDPVTGFSYSCDAGSPSLHFTDVLATDAFCKHVHFLWAKGIVTGCGATLYCPTGLVGRDEMAKFLGNAFALLLYGP